MLCSALTQSLCMCNLLVFGYHLVFKQQASCVSLQNCWIIAVSSTFPNSVQAETSPNRSDPEDVATSSPLQAHENLSLAHGGVESCQSSQQGKQQDKALASAQPSAHFRQPDGAQTHVAAQRPEQQPDEQFREDVTEPVAQSAGQLPIVVAFPARAANTAALNTDVTRVSAARIVTKAVDTQFAARCVSSAVNNDAAERQRHVAAQSVACNSAINAAVPAGEITSSAVSFAAQSRR